MAQHIFTAAKIGEGPVLRQSALTSESRWTYSFTQNVLLSIYYVPEPVFIFWYRNALLIETHKSYSHRVCIVLFRKSSRVQGREWQGMKIAQRGRSYLWRIGKLRGIFWTNVCSLSQMLILLIWIHFSFPQIQNERTPLWSCGDSVLATALRQWDQLLFSLIQYLPSG